MGDPEDVMRNFVTLESEVTAQNGLEMCLFTSKLRDINQFEPWFYRKISNLKYKTVHIGEDDNDFIINSKNIKAELAMLSKMLDRLEVDTIILHASHLKQQRKHIRKLFSSALPNTTICVENNSFDDEWGGSIDGLIEIFNDCPEFKFCLDIAHVKDFNTYKLWDWVNQDQIKKRIKEIHFSFSTHLLDDDPYVQFGYHNYNPYHALFSLIKEPLSFRTKEFIRQYPIVIEGVVPCEDKKLDFLRKEIELLS